jgi:histidine triad (HIT) family protein
MEQMRIFNTTNDKCTFCKIIRSEIKSYIGFEDEFSLAFLDHRPLLPGHLLFVPKNHYETLIDLPSDIVAPFFANVKLLAEAVEVGLDAEGSFVAINTRIAQSVPHLHVHIVPRWKKDGLFSTKNYIWQRRPYKDEDEIIKVQTSIRSTIAELQKKYIRV